MASDVDRREHGGGTLARLWAKDRPPSGTGMTGTGDVIVNSSHAATDLTENLSAVDQHG